MSLMHQACRRLKYKFLNNTSPVVASIKVTQKCNLKCSHCPWLNKQDDLPLHKWKSIIDIVHNRGCDIIFIEGGEPTLRPDLQDIINYIKKKGMVCIMLTNGTKPLPGNLDSIWVSIDGTEKVHDIMRGNGTYNKAMSTIKNAPNIYSITTLSRINSAEIEEICSNLSATGLRGLIFNFMYPYSDTNHYALHRDERVNCARQLLNLKTKYPKIINSDSYLRSVRQQKKVCYPWLLLQVTADGRINHGCTVAAIEEPNCEECDMLCGLESTLGFELHRDSMEFWKHFHIQGSNAPNWVLRFLRLNRKL